MSKKVQKAKKIERPAVFVRTCTDYYTGELISKSKDELVLRKAAWIADTGRLATFLASGVAEEVEPYPDSFEVHVSMGSVVSWCYWPHALPREQK